jgi:iron complex outermembrane receptor protein
MRLLKSKLVASSMIASGLLIAAPLAAQAAAPAAADTTNQVAEVVVTATKTAVNVQNVPIAVTAVTAKTLQQKGINDVSKLSQIAPNVTLDAGTPFSGSNAVLSAYIRGIGQDDFAFNLDPGVGVYVDGVYLARSVGANTNMLDVDRVEILKGPQGTLFGRNTIGGAISIVTRDPGKEFAFRGEVTTGQFSRLDVSATADMPINDKVLTSITFAEQHRNGWQHRIPFPGIRSGQTDATGAPLIPDCNASVPAGQLCPVVFDATTQYPASGYESSQRPGGINQWSGRGKVLILPSDNFKITIGADYTYIDQPASPNTALRIDPALGLSALYNACISIPAAVMPFTGLADLCGPRDNVSPTPANAQPLPGLGSVNVDGNPNNNRIPYGPWFQTGSINSTYETGNSFSRLKNGGADITLDWAVAPETNLKLISAYRELHWDSGMDLDGSPLSELEPSFDMTQHQWSEELQLTGKAFNDRLSYVVGGYYFYEAGHLHDYVRLGTLQIDGPNDLWTRAEAIYTHLNFKVNDQISLTAGGRYSWEQKRFEGHQTDDNAFSYKIAQCFPASAASPVPGQDCQQFLGFPSAAEPYRYFPPGIFHLNFDNFSPTAGIEWHPTMDAMIYASWSKGFKTGSWTTRLSVPNTVYNDSLHFNPEHATTEELGFKTEWFDRHLRLNVAGFHTDYEGIQLNSQIGPSPTIVNAGDARIWGAEAEADAILGHGFSFTASLGYTDAKYTSIGFTDSAGVHHDVTDNGFVLTTTSCPEQLPYTGPNSRFNNPHAQNGACDLPKTPKLKIYYGPQYLAYLGNSGQLQFNVDWTYTSQLYNDIGNVRELRRPHTNIVNASVTYRAPEDHWEVSVGGTNLTNQRYVVSGQWQGAISVIDAVYSDPTEWFATVRFKY